MKCTSKFAPTVLGGLLLLLIGVAPATKAAQKQPVYIYLYARVTDHVNLDLSEDQLRRILPMIERYRKAHPEAHISATILFSGAISQALAERNAQTGIKDYVLGFARRGVIDLGYDGTDEPTYQRRPAPDFSETKTNEERWLARGDAAERLLSEARDPLTGVPQPGVAGGLKKMQEVFGEAACITGITEDVGGDSEAVQHVDRYNTKALMFGLPEPNPARHIEGYRVSATNFGRIVSPTPESSPDLYWQDNVLRSSEASDAALRVVQGYEGVDGIKSVLGKLDRSRVRVVHVELGSEQNYLRPPYTQGLVHLPLQLAYDHPEQPKIPQELLRDPDDVDAAYAKEGALIKWLLEDYFPATPGSRFVSSADLKRMTPPAAGFSISVDGLRAALADMLKGWGNNTYLVDYSQVDGHYLSPADMFQVQADVLAQLNRTGKLPASVRVGKVYGPIETPGDHGPAVGEVTVASVARVCAGIADRLHDTTWSPIPKNAIPSRLTVDGIQVNAAQFLRLMAEALVAPSPETKLSLKMTYMYSLATETCPTTHTVSELGATWTFKPAPLETEQVSDLRR